ncbi:SDR family NAD(P)-dependent oxidoreductase [Prosthecomicrobium hirschii]|uniref:SDR family NAD(P)-dependent oxidoreductase n=1 Tax=Prosthecodimorpha hirschii TaxID=665126 RepID=UPI0011284699|nr:SDR family oxidoreductase [Prosthecomicrobium hirschii]MCW1840270.1 SDR family oxidoreductase [Prosthecomicrobium hirschii]TPQ52047.1 oxidoreductase [Prosthecomicrobium hirschii]
MLARSDIAPAGRCPFPHGEPAGPEPERRRTVVVTGGSRGIGHAIVKRFAAEGWRIMTCSRQPFDAGLCPWETGADDHIRLDLADRNGLPEGIAEIRRRLAGAPLDALVNNAGISPKGAAGERLNALTTPDALWMGVFHVNFLAPLLLARGLFEELARARGSVVNITSVVGTRVHPFAGAAYATSKAALSALTREMAVDFAPYGIRVNAVAPGEIVTDILSPGTEERFVPLIPMKRLGRPEEVAAVVSFLCSEAASYVTGEEININGGQLL